MLVVLISQIRIYVHVYTCESSDILGIRIKLENATEPVWELVVADHCVWVKEENTLVTTKIINCSERVGPLPVHGPEDVRVSGVDWLILVEDLSKCVIDCIPIISQGV